MLRMRIRKGYKVRDIAGERVVVMPGTAGVDMTRIVALNATADWLWNRLREAEFTGADVAEMLSSEYGIDPVRAGEDAGRWVGQMRACGLLDESRCDER